jgi:DNA-binding XRE family transcriptional regulator
MTPADFRAWIHELGWTRKEAADNLGVSLHAINSWCKPANNKSSRPVPLTVIKLMNCLATET